MCLNQSLAPGWRGCRRRRRERKERGREGAKEGEKGEGERGEKGRGRKRWEGERQKRGGRIGERKFLLDQHFRQIR